MAYLPKSKYSVKTTHGGELVYKNKQNTFYIGDYIIASNGKYHAGTSNIKLGPELIIPEEPSAGEQEKMQGTGKDVKKHKIFKKKIKKFLLETQQIPRDKPLPTDKEYEQGFFKRYFTKRINGNEYIEINKKTFDDIKAKKPKYDYNLYEIGSITWHLIGNVYKKNSITITNKQKYYPHIKDYFPILDEHSLGEPLYQSHLYTEGNELYTSKGREYIGDYHIHTTGPMMGPIHTDQPHERLYYISKLSAPPDTTYEDFLASTLANPPSNEPTINKEPNKETSKEQNQILQDEQFQNTEWDGEAGDDHDDHDGSISSFVGTKKSRGRYRG